MNKLYIRIWLAVVLAVAVLTLLVGWIWRLAAEPPLRDVVVRNEAGQVIGRGRRPAAPDDADRAGMRASLAAAGATLPPVPPASLGPRTT